MAMTSSARKRRRNSKKRKWFLIGTGVVLAVMLIYFASSRTTLLPAYFRLPAPHPSPGDTRDERWRQDVQYLASQLPRLHVNAFHAAGWEEFERAVATLDTTMPELSDIEIVLGIMRIVASIGDAHTRAVPPPSMALNLYPLRLRWLADGFYVTGAAEAYQEAVGARVVRIGETSIEEAFAAMAPFVSHETETGLRDGVWLYLLGSDILQAMDILTDTPLGHYTLEQPDGTRFTLDLHTVAADEYFAIVETLPAGEPLYRQRPEEFYWYEYLADEQAVYFNYRRCQDMESQSFRDFVAEMFAFIDARPVTHLVVDLRDNGGGDSEHIRPFLKALAQRPALDREGYLFVVVGRGTYSSAMLNAVELDHKTNAVFVGELPSSLPNHYGEAAAFVLPNSRIRIDYSTKYFATTRFTTGEKMSLGDWLGVLGYSSARFPVGGAGVKPFAPDVWVEPTIEDYLAGRDAALKAVLDY
jgi:hypothetical protein